MAVLTSPPNLNVPANHGLVAWNFDPMAGTSATAMTTGVLYLAKVPILYDVTVTNINISISTVGVTLTANQNLAALYSSTGVKLGVSADQAAAWVSTGTKTMALTTPYAAVPGTYYVGLLTNGSTGAAPTRTGSAAIVNIGQTTNARWLTYSTGLTAMPDNVTMASAAAGVNSFWTGLS